MLYEIIREIVSRIARDKVLMGLIVILVLGSFWGGMQVKHGEGDREGDIPHEQAANDVRPNPEAKPAQLDAGLACDFVKWWLTSAMDYSAKNSTDGHAKAFGWMTADAQQAFKTAFWSPDIAAGIAAGQISASYHLVSVQPVAVNPDGSVVVCANGTFVYQSSGNPTSQQMQTDYLVRKDPAGLRIAGLYNRVSQLSSSSAY